MRDHIPFNEETLAHSDSPLALSDWQKLADPTGSFATTCEEFDARPSPYWEQIVYRAYAQDLRDEADRALNGVQLRADDGGASPL